MRSVTSFLAAGAATLMTTAAFAADMPSIAPPPPMLYAPAPVAEEFGGWYLRGDIGQTSTSGKLHYNALDTLPAGSVVQQGQGFTGGTSFGIGVGYQFNGWLRADITGEFRSKVAFAGSDFITFPTNAIGDSYYGGYSSWVGMANAYADLGTWWCVTPFVGFGVGAARITTAGFTDTGAIPGGGPALYYAQGATATNFAWAAHAGLAYKVTNNFTVELAYRYMNLGTAVHGVGRSFDGSNAGQSSFQYRDLTTQDIRLGVRWNLDAGVYSPPPPPVLMRRG